MLKDKNILITGISGFVGSNLAKYLLEQGAIVYGLIVPRADGEIPKNLIDQGISTEIKPIYGNILDIPSIVSALDESQPDVIFHLAAQSYVPRSFRHPIETMEINCSGTMNLLEAVRIKELDPKVIFAGSSEEYGLVFSSQRQYEETKKKYATIFPEPEKIPELPIAETNPLRPMSPYAMSKACGDYMMRNYYHSYGMKTIVSRSFNNEGAGRSIMFVTSSITSQAMAIKQDGKKEVVVGNINAFRDWSHVKDIVNGYCLLAEKGKYGEVYNQGSERTNSVLSYLLQSLVNVGYYPDRIETFKNNKIVENPVERDTSKIFGVSFEKTKIDMMILENKIEFGILDEGLMVHTSKGNLKVNFDPDKFRPADAPILLADARKVKGLGFKIMHTLENIIQDQLNFYSKPARRQVNSMNL